ncbi:uncharacterized protein E0L32_007713 [Thyridium curvatum]|uniref:Zn(2)-C6 fungal-type domain-containing protein n=1 Tax=Thyridium curvatum TaxID=1093900 RepID=A0A507ANL4_9PEZI|nr:uncharacterized protein E0L32_007713 [Thyridium curvatum]TPX11502.1 hypothetical protein E0L32_007713 [Thyridium curvatum]
MDGIRNDCGPIRLSSTMQRVTRAQANAGRVACTVCHHRKVKCDAHDGGFPCTNCQKSDRPRDCHLYLKRKRTSRASKTREESTQQPFSTPGPIFLPTPARDVPKPTQSEIDIESILAGSDAASATTSLLAQATPRHLDEVPVSTIPSYQNAIEVGNRAQEDDSGVNGVHADPSVDGEYKRYLVEFIDQPQITERPIDKDARIMYVGSEVSNVNFLLRQQLGNKTSGVCHYPTNRIARQLTCHEPDRLPVEAFQLPPKKVVDELLAAYFEQINPGFPVVDETLFMAHYHAKDPQNAPSLLLLHAIMLAGAHVLYEQPQRDTYKALFFRRAKILFDARFERNRDVIVQAALLLTWHADGPEDVGANAWHWIGVATRHATGLGMHRDAEKSTLVAHNKRMWRRVWWLLFQCDVLVSLQYGRPQSIHLDDTDVKMLEPGDFHGCGAKTRVDHVIHTAELCVIISKILRRQSRPGTSPEVRLASMRKADESLANWSIQLPQPLQLNIGPNLDPWTALVQLQYNTVLLLLHRQQPYPEADDDVRPDDVDICTNAAVAIQQIFQYLNEREQIKYLWTSAINFLFTALIQLSVEVRIANPVLAISAIRRYDSALSSLRRVAEYWPNAQSVIEFFENSVRLQGVNEAQTTQEPSAEDATTAHDIGQELHAGEVEQPENFNIALQSLESGTDPYGLDLAQLFTNIMSGRQYPQSDEAVGNPWSEWQRIYWQRPGCPDDLLFTF